MLEATTKPVPDPRLLVAAWYSIAVLLALAGVLTYAPSAGPAMLVVSCATWIVLYRRRGHTRRWLDSIPLRPLIALHAIRLPIGAVFLFEASHGRLAPLFASRAGWGDIATGALAIVVAGFAWKRRGVVRAFTIIGLLDILFALGTGMYLAFGVRDPLMLDAIARLPFPLLPLAIVPTVILTHLLVLARLRRTTQA
ncbi:MAG: hypothetical protein M4D80_08495 [Myxococcota bacterium]|nr:hypothetical protein [Myxococcota bacterium]